MKASIFVSNNELPLDLPARGNNNSLLRTAWLVFVSFKKLTPKVSETNFPMKIVNFLPHVALKSV